MSNLLTLLRIKEQLNRMEKRIIDMAIDTTKLQAAVTHLEKTTEALLADRAATRDQISALQGQLAAAIAAADPAALAAAQTTLDAIALSLEDEATKADTSLQPPASPTPAADPVPAPGE